MAIDNLIGRVIDGRYRVDAEIGEGAMGIVYRGRHVRLDRDVAIKVLRSDVSHSDSVLRFLNEAKIASSLKHPNLVDVMDCGELDGSGAYYVMELLRGETLHATLERELVLEPKLAFEIVMQMIDGLRVAHTRETVHRDLKPENVFLCSGDSLSVKVLDFGIARAKGGTNTVPGTVLGTPEFMAPEQARGDVVDTRADLYAVGVMLFEMLSGCIPLYADDIGDLLMLKLNSTAPRLDESAPNLGHLKLASDLLADLLERDPKDRVQTIEEVASRLRAAQAQDLASNRSMTEPASEEVPLHRRRTRGIGSRDSGDSQAAAAVAGGWRRPGTRLPSIGLVPAPKGRTMIAMADAPSPLPAAPQPAADAGSGDGQPRHNHGGQPARSPRQFVMVAPNPVPVLVDEAPRSSRGAAPSRPKRGALPPRAAKVAGRGAGQGSKRSAGLAPLLLSIAALVGACIAAAFVFFGGRPINSSPVNEVRPAVPAPVQAAKPEVPARGQGHRELSDEPEPEPEPEPESEPVAPSPSVETAIQRPSTPVPEKKPVRRSPKVRTPKGTPPTSEAEPAEKPTPPKAEPQPSENLDLAEPTR